MGRATGELTTFTDVEAYAASVLPRLEADEPQFNLALAVISSLRTGRLVPDAPPFLASISDGADEVAVLHTPPFGLLLTGLPEGAAPTVVSAVLAGGYRPPLVLGPPEAVEPVVAEWTGRTGATVTAARNQGIYAISNLLLPPPVDGSARIAAQDDTDLVFDWFSEFSRELELHPTVRREQVDQRVASGDITLWCLDDEAVSLAGVGGRTTHGARIGPVFTPLAHRGRGYAGAVTAAVTRRCFDEGAQQCYLYTDLANPTSNRLYQRLGYQRVAASVEMSLAEQPGPAGSR